MKQANELGDILSLFRTDRRSHQRCPVRIGVLRNFTKFTGKHLCQSLFFNKVFFKKRVSGTGVFL